VSSAQSCVGAAVGTPVGAMDGVAVGPFVVGAVVGATLKWQGSVTVHSYPDLVSCPGPMHRVVSHT
jgi:hypothetical protein